MFIPITYNLFIIVNLLLYIIYKICYWHHFTFISVAPRDGMNYKILCLMFQAFNMYDNNNLFRDNLFYNRCLIILNFILIYPTSTKDTLELSTFLMRKYGFLLLHTFSHVYVLLLPQLFAIWGDWSLNPLSIMMVYFGIPVYLNVLTTRSTTLPCCWI